MSRVESRFGGWGVGVGGIVACHSKKDCQKAVALVQVGDNDGKSRAVAVGVERRGWIRDQLGGGVGRLWWRRVPWGTGPMGDGLSGTLGTGHRLCCHHSLQRMVS